MDVKEIPGSSVVAVDINELKVSEIMLGNNLKSHVQNCESLCRGKSTLLIRRKDL